MRRQPSLAEILSDDTGSIRAEIADLLMEPNPQRAPAVHRAQPQLRPLTRGWLNFALFVALVVLIVGAFSHPSVHRNDSMEVKEKKAVVVMPAAAPVPVADVQAWDREQRIEDKAQDHMQEGDNAMNSSPVQQEQEEPPQWNGNIGRIIGDCVPVLTEPSYRGAVINTLRLNDTVIVCSFYDGWYRVSLPNDTAGYVFGAYLISRTVRAYPYRAVTLRDGRTQMLLKEEGYENYLRVIQPNGIQGWLISRAHVRSFRDEDEWR